MKRMLRALLLTSALMLALAAPAAAGGGGVNPAQLGRAGWTCFDVPSLGVHCSPPGAPFGLRTASPLLYFIATTDPNDAEATLTGTEQLLSSSVYHGQPCPQEGLDEWHDLGLVYACHHK